MLRWHRLHWVLLDMGPERDRYPSSSHSCVLYKLPSSDSTPPLGDWPSGLDLERAALEYETGEDEANEDGECKDTEKEFWLLFGFWFELSCPWVLRQVA